MKVESFAIRDKELVGFAEGSTGRRYILHWDIKSWKEEWEKKNICLNDFLDKKAFAITQVRNCYPAKKTNFIIKEI